jgi:hypothetical protein
MSEFLKLHSTKWFVIVLMILLVSFVVACVMIGAVAVQNKHVCDPFETQTVHGTDNTTPFLMLSNTALYPYNGLYDEKTLNTSLNTCISKCLDDTSCNGFQHFNYDSRVDEQNNCYFYYNNNVNNNFLTTGSDSVELASYYKTIKLTVAAELLGESTDVYIKQATDFQVLRSYTIEPTLV